MDIRKSEVNEPFKIKIAEDIGIWFKEIKFCHVYFLMWYDYLVKAPFQGR